MISGHTILVIIGYSFPFFNREYDRKIIEILKNSGLNKVYYQDIINKGDFLSSQFNIKNDIIENYDRVGQFFVPPEL